MIVFDLKQRELQRQRARELFILGAVALANALCGFAYLWSIWP